MLWIIGGLVLQMLLLKTAGFSIATGLLFAFAARGFGRGPLWFTIPLGIVHLLRDLAACSRACSSSRCPAGPIERLVF